MSENLTVKAIVDEIEWEHNATQSIINKIYQTIDVVNDGVQFYLDIPNEKDESPIQPKEAEVSKPFT